VSAADRHMVKATVFAVSMMLFVEMRTSENWLLNTVSGFVAVIAYLMTASGLREVVCDD
jgi:hypothetical protein